MRSRGNDRSTDGRSVRLSEPVSTKDGDGLEEPLDRWECTLDGDGPQPIDRQASTKNLDCPHQAPKPNTQPAFLPQAYPYPKETPDGISRGSHPPDPFVVACPFGWGGTSTLPFIR